MITAIHYDGIKFASNNGKTFISSNFDIIGTNPSLTSKKLSIYLKTVNEYNKFFDVYIKISC